MGAVGPLTHLIDRYERPRGTEDPDMVPMLYLSVALSRTAGEEDRASGYLRQSRKALIASRGPPPRNTDVIMPEKNPLWARANMARMYRRSGRSSAAMTQERLAR